MRVTGVITEYNPFHNGHRYHLATARALTKADTVVVAMSGNFVQRGEPALIDKWHRAEAALHNGADAVYELPFAWAVQPAHLFARGAVQLLAAAGVDTIVFGAEHADLDYLAVAQQLANSDDDQALFKDYQQTYATSFNQQVTELTGLQLTEPNDILGLAYAQAVVELGLTEQIKLLPIQRVKAGYHQKEITDAQIASATALRELIQRGGQADELANYMPDQLASQLSTGGQVVPWEAQWFELLRYRVLTTPITELEKIYQLNDGLAQRLQQTMTPTINWNDFMTAFKSKRYTYARLHRCLLYVILNITTDEMHAAWQDPYLRLLGTNAQGRRFLKEQRKGLAYPTINRVTRDEVQGLLKLDVRTGQLYQIMSRPGQKAVEQDLKRHPLLIERG